MVKIAIPLPANMLLVRYLFAWGRDLRSLHAKARAFDFDTAHCTVEADRALIKQSVATACRHSGIVSPNVSDADAIAKLQQNISTLAPTWVEEAMGSTGITLRFAFVTMLPFFAVFLDNFLADARLVFLGNMSRDALLVSLVRTYANGSCAMFYFPCSCHYTVRAVRESWGRLQTWAVAGANAFSFSAVSAHMHLAMVFLPQETAISSWKVLLFSASGAITTAACWCLFGQCAKPAMPKSMTKWHA